MHFTFTVATFATPKTPNTKHTEYQYCRTPDWQSSPVQLLIGKSGRLYIRVVGCSVGRHGRDSSDVTLALEDAQVVRRSVGRY